MESLPNMGTLESKIDQANVKLDILYHEVFGNGKEGLRTAIATLTERIAGIAASIERVEESVGQAVNTISTINTTGCAHRAGDLSRLTRLEEKFDESPSGGATYSMINPVMAFLLKHPSVLLVGILIVTLGTANVADIMFSGNRTETIKQYLSEVVDAAVKKELASSARNSQAIPSTASTP